jgi:hypothetical protein
MQMQFQNFEFISNAQGVLAARGTLRVLYIVDLCACGAASRSY